MIIPSQARIHAAYDHLWLTFTENYLQGTHIPVTYAKDLYPWLGDRDLLDVKLGHIFHNIPYEDTTQHLLNMVNLHARPLNGGATTQPFQHLPADAKFRADLNPEHIIAYRKLDAFLSLINLVMTAAENGTYRTSSHRNYLNFLRDPDTVTVFASIGTYIRMNEHRIPTD